MRFLFWFLLLLTACAQAPQVSDQQNSQAVYRHDLQLTINGQSCVGACVVARAAKYDVTVNPLGKIDRIMWQTCHQEYVVDSPKSGWFDKKFNFALLPTLDLEDSSACALEVGVFEERKKRNGWAVVDFTDKRPEVSLPAKIQCNGLGTNSSGVSICQSAAGLVQEIIFDQPVIVNPNPECGIEPAKDEKTFKFSMPIGKCTYYFVSNEKAANGKRKVHRLNTIGYTDVPYRE